MSFVAIEAVLGENDDVNMIVDETRRKCNLDVGHQR